MKLWNCIQFPLTRKKKNELKKKRNDTFSEYSIESRISRLLSCIEMANILDEWYTETKQDMEKAESFRKLKEGWNNEIMKLKNEQIEEESSS